MNLTLLSLSKCPTSTLHFTMQLTFLIPYFRSNNIQVTENSTFLVPIPIRTLTRMAGTEVDDPGLFPSQWLWLFQISTSTMFLSSIWV